MEPEGYAQEEDWCQETLAILLRSRGSKLPHHHPASQQRSWNETPGHQGPESTHLAFVLCSPQLPEPPTQVSRQGRGRPSVLQPQAQQGAPLCSAPETLEWAFLRCPPGPGTQL